MEEKTINGRPKSEVIQLFAEPFAESEMKKDYDGHLYIPVECFQERLNAVIGLNWDFQVGTVEYKQVGTKLCVYTNGHLTIRYDDGSICCERWANGGKDVIFPSASQDSPKSLPNDIKGANSDALKACCGMLGIAKTQMKQLNAKTKPVKSDATSESYRVKITGNFAALNGKGYACPGEIENTNEKVKVMFWSDAVAAISQTCDMKKFMELAVGKTFSFVAQKKEYKGEMQLTVRGMVPKDSAA